MSRSSTFPLVHNDHVPSRASNVLTVALAATCLLAACTASDLDRTEAGTVIALRPALCIASGHAAEQCFYGAAATSSGLRPGECVSVTFASPDGEGRYRLKSVNPAHAKDHPWCL
jgi:chemotaxis response regulator CheB